MNSNNKNGGDVCSITIEFSRQEFDRIRKIADVMNGVDWCECDNTPATVVKNFLICFDETEWANEVVCGIWTGFKDGEAECERRKNVLRTKFAAAGL